MHIAVVTPLFPLPDQPYRGRAIYETVRALTRYADVQAICPIPINPSWAAAFRPRLLTKLAETPSPAGVRATYFSYPVVPLLSRGWNGDVCARHLYRYLEKLRPDVVLCYWLYPEGYAGVKVSHALGVPVIVGSRGSDLRRIQDFVTRSLTARTIRQADYVLTVSQELRTQALLMGAAEERSASIPNGCDREVFHPDDRAAIRRSVGVSPGEKIILYVGRLVRSKGLMELWEAFLALTRELPDLRLVCLGSGPLASEMASLASQVKVRVLMAGDQPPAEVARWMNAADLFCLPSHSEGCPNVAIEAISCGCPVVATDVGGTPEVVTPDCGILIPARDPARLIAALRACLLRAWDRDAIASKFGRTWDSVAQETYHVCQTVAHAAAPRVSQEMA